MQVAGVGRSGTKSIGSAQAENKQKNKQKNSNYESNSAKWLIGKFCILNSYE